MASGAAAPLALGSLFTGGGGLDYGLEQAGFETRWQVEWDPWDQHLLEHGWGGRWAGLARYSDIHDVDSTAVEPVDILAGGFPCQPVSVAGKRLAQLDERWLWPEFARAIRDLRPRAVVVENVAGLLARGIDDVLGTLATIGYDAEWTCYPASALGAPHYRDRVWLVAYPARGGRDVADPDGRLSDDEDRPVRPGRPAVAGGGGRALADAGRAGRQVAEHPEHARGSDGAGEAAQPARRGAGQRDVPHTEDQRGVGTGLREGGSRIGRRRPDHDSGPAPELPDAERAGDGRAWLGAERSGTPWLEGDEGSWPGWLTSAMADASRLGMERDGTDWLVQPPAPALALILGRYGAGRGADQWATEPSVGRMAHGVARRGDRLWTLGNGVVPACAEVMGWLIRHAIARGDL